MDDSVLVGVVDGSGGLPHERGHRQQVHRPIGCQPLRQGLALDQLHCNPGTVRVLARIEDGENPRVIESGRGLTLSPESLRRGPIGLQVGRQPLDRQLASKQGVGGPPDSGHSPDTDLLLEGVTTIDHRSTLYGVDH